MPVIRRRSRWPAGRDLSELVNHLAQELGGGSTEGGPVIFEFEREVLVVWDAWEGIANNDRATIIREAYREHARVHSPEDSPDEGADYVYGATVEEALEHGLLPYNVVPHLADGPDVRDEVERAMTGLGGIRIGGRIELRAPSHGLARELRDQLVERLASEPEVRFSIAQTVGSQVDMS